MTPILDNKSIVRAFVAAINAQDWSKLDQVVAADFVRHSHAAGRPEVQSREQLKDFLRGEFRTFPDAHEAIVDLIAEDDKVAARQSFRGSQHGPMGPYPATGKVLAAEYIAIYRIHAGQIVEAWAEWDNLDGLTQLGHIPGSLPNPAFQGT